MKVGEFVRWIAPPILLDLLRGTQQRHSAFPLWEGVYKHHRDVPAEGPLFEGETWVKQTEAYTRATLAASKGARTIPSGVIGEHMLLPLLASQLCRQKGLHYLLEAWCKLQLANAELRIVGNPPRSKAILVRARDSFSWPIELARTSRGIWSGKSALPAIAQ